MYYQSIHPSGLGRAAARGGIPGGQTVGREAGGPWEAVMAQGGCAKSHTGVIARTC